MQSECYITMVLKLLNMHEITVIGLGNIGVWCYMVAVYTNSLGIIGIYHN